MKLTKKKIDQAQRDVMKGRNQANRRDYDSAVLFFRSELYVIMLDYVGCYFPDVGQRLPEGVVL